MGFHPRQSNLTHLGNRFPETLRNVDQFRELHVTYWTTHEIHRTDIEHATQCSRGA